MPADELRRFSCVLTLTLVEGSKRIESVSELAYGAPPEFRRNVYIQDGKIETDADFSTEALQQAFTRYDKT